VLDAISGIGERLSAPLVAGALLAIGVRSISIAATEVIVTDPHHGRAEPLMAQTRQRSEARSARGTLREQGAELMRLSADVETEDGAHPAYARILSEIAPDEGRILRLLMLEGPQPCVDIRAANLIGVGSQLVAEGLTMIGTEAGCRYLDRVPAYLNNLRRLGLIAISDEPVADPARYQVLEAQPDALEAMRHAGRVKTAHRRIEMTPFGIDFCETVLPLEVA